MYADIKVEIPQDTGRITRKTIKGTSYIYYTIHRSYSPEKKYSIPKTTTIGKEVENDPTMMYPNEKYRDYFPEAQLPEIKDNQARSFCLKIGATIVLKKIIKDYRLDEMITELVGEESGLFLDLAAYTVITEGNAAQYYPDYAFNHPLFTEDMRIYSDSKVSRFLSGIEKGVSAEFLNRWNSDRDHLEKIYISYDATNKKCEAGEIDFVEVGHLKNEHTGPLINYSIAYDTNNREPLFYEMYPGSIVDISQLDDMLNKAKGYGYNKAAFILDRGYFSKGNIRMMDKCGYEFVIMMKGMKSLAREVILEHRGSFEELREHSLRDYKVSGMSVKQRLFDADEKERTLHIFYNSRKQASEREQLEERIDRLGEALKRKNGTKDFVWSKAVDHYFEPFYHTKGNETAFIAARERDDVINEEIKLCGYFMIVTSEDMSAAEALSLYKSRDTSEKLFRGDKTYLGNNSLRVASNESASSKILIEFVALILRNKLYTCLKDRMKNNKRQNYMTVPAALRELEKIEMVKQNDGCYRMSHAITATQKEILKSFNMTEDSIRREALRINELLKKPYQLKV